MPQLTVPDNLKSGVSQPCRYEPGINRSYLEMARHYRTTIIPARPNKPRDKAKVEVGVLVVQRWILACLGIFRLNKQYPAQRIEDACRRALKYRTCSYQSLKAILAAGLDRQADQARPAPVVSPVHENVRGHDYYRGGENHAQ